MKTALVARLGAIGDMVLISPVLQQLKTDGYHVTMLCKEHGPWLFRGTGIVDKYQLWSDEDEAWVQARAKDEGEIYWKCMERIESYFHGYDKCLNLNGVIEGNMVHRVFQFSEDFLKKHPQGKELWERFGHGKWATGKHQHRHENHTDWVMMKSGYVGDEYKGRIPVYKVLPEERKWAYKLFKKHGVTSRHFKIVIQLSGSGIAKTWPYIPDYCQQIARMIPHVKIFTIGIGADEMLEWYWTDKMPWVIPLAKRSPVKSNGDYIIQPAEIRRYAALIEQSDLLIAPDTSFLHISAGMDVHKIALYTITHHINIGKYYKNCHPIQSMAECSPCGKITSDCQHGTRGAAYCMEEIKPLGVLNLTREVYEQWQSAKQEQRQLQMA